MKLSFYIKLLLFGALLVSAIPVNAQVRNIEPGNRIVGRNGKAGIQQPYEIVERYARPFLAKEIYLSEPTSNSAGFIKAIVPVTLLSNKSRVETGVKWFNQNRSLVQELNFEVKERVLQTGRVSGFERKETLQLTSNANFGLLIIKIGETRTANQIISERFTRSVIDKTGNTLWSEEVEKPYYGGLSVIIVADFDGRHLEQFFQGEIYREDIAFYDANHNLLSRIKPINSNDLIVGHVYYSDNGEFLVTNCFEMPAGPDIQTSTIIKYRYNGEELWRYDLGSGLPQLIKISSDGRYIIVSSVEFVLNQRQNERTLLFGPNGSVIREFQGMYATQVKFSPELDHVYINGTYNDNEVHVVDLSNGEDIFSLHAMNVRDAGLLSSKQMIVLWNGRLVSVYQFDGTPLFKYTAPRDYPEQKIHSSLPENRSEDLSINAKCYVNVSLDGEEFLIVSAIDITRYRLNK